VLFELAKPLIYTLDPEHAHERMVGVMKRVQRSPLMLGIVQRHFNAPPIPTVVAGLQCRNPVGLAAGFDKNCEMIPALAALGFGFLEVGTVTRHAQPGNPRPRIFRYPDLKALVNRLGFNNVGVEAAAKILEQTRRPGIPIGVNVGKSAVTALEDAPAEYAESLKIVFPLGDYFTLNISSPNTQDLRKLHEPDRLKQLFDTVGNAVAGFSTRKPIFLKLSPDAELADLEVVARMAAQYGHGLIATNTTVDRTGLNGLEKGGLSGAPLKDRALNVLKHLRGVTGPQVPILGVGGIFTSSDAAERLAAGANAVQVYTGIIYEGPGIVQQIVQGLHARA